MRSTPTRLSTLLVVLAAAALMAPAAASAKCVKLPKKAFIYAIGSSTMGISLGPALERPLEKAGFRFRKWAKASSGLARKDFHDWPKQVPEVVREWKPDAFIISLGTNDYQAMFTDDGWIKPEKVEKWKAAYADRVDEMLERAAGKDKARPVIWVGPTPFDTPRARRMSAMISGIIKSRIEKFGGNVHYIDMVAKLMPGKRPLKTMKDAKGKKRTIYGKDRIHMTRWTVNNLMAKPVLDLLICE